MILGCLALLALYVLPAVIFGCDGPVEFDQRRGKGVPGMEGLRRDR